MVKYRRTKIVATLGPSTSDKKVIEQLVLSGVDVFRLNFSHGFMKDHRDKTYLVRDIASRLGRSVAIMGDLQGPKIRITGFKEKEISLKPGDDFILSCNFSSELGSTKSVGVDYPDLITDCKIGDNLILDDGRVELIVEKIYKNNIHTRVLVGGILSSNKGINRRGGGLSAPSLTEKDLKDISLSAELNLDYLAVSFLRYSTDVENVRTLVRSTGSHAWIIVKIERAEAVINDESLDSLIQASDGVMVARGDLGVEIGDAELVGIQKRIIRRARTFNKAVITATQMMESMILNSMPTRAEVSDVANAVLDCTDAVMLSAETASGKYPVEAVKAMSRICIGAEKHPTVTNSQHRLGEMFERCDETIALSAMYAANHFPGIKAIISLTESGRTPLIMSRIRSGIPIYSYSQHQETLNRVALFRGVNPLSFDALKYPADEMHDAAIERLKMLNLIEQGDWIVLVRGNLVCNTGGTNSLRILQVK